MVVYMGWYDPDKKKDLPTKIRGGIVGYERKNGTRPTVVVCRTDADLYEVDGVRVIPSPWPAADVLLFGESDWNPVDDNDDSVDSRYPEMSRSDIRGHAENDEGESEVVSFRKIEGDEKIKVLEASKPKNGNPYMSEFREMLSGLKAGEVVGFTPEAGMGKTSRGIKVGVSRAATDLGLKLRWLPEKDGELVFEVGKKDAKK